MQTFCQTCGVDFLYCDDHDAYLCVECDTWIEKACSDPECSFCPTRPEAPSGCQHVDPHWKTH